MASRITTFRLKNVKILAQDAIQYITQEAWKLFHLAATNIVTVQNFPTTVFLFPLSLFSLAATKLVTVQICPTAVSEQLFIVHMHVINLYLFVIMFIYESNKLCDRRMCYLFCL